MTQALQQALNEGHALTIRRYPANRLCRKVNCSTRLSIYTEGPYCHVHEDYGFRFDLAVEEKKRIARVKAQSKRSRDQWAETKKENRRKRRLIERGKQ